jgi:hypothetical protein
MTPTALYILPSPTLWGRCRVAAEGASSMNAPPHRLRRSSPANGGAELQERRLPPFPSPTLWGRCRVAAEGVRVQRDRCRKFTGMTQRPTALWSSRPLPD